MSIKDLFNKKTAFFENATTGSSKVESKDLVLSTFEKEEQFIPNIDFASASNFAKFGSAKLYYTTALERVYDDYPYDGSKNEKLLFELSSSYLDRWIFNNKYPKSTGYINFSYGGWGSLNGSLSSDGYGLPASLEYIYVRGALPTASLTNKPLWKTFDDSIVYDSNKERTTTFVLNITDGFTVEFWLKKGAFDITKTKKEVIFDLWNSELSSSSDYGRFILELSGTSTGTDTFRVSLQSGSNGFFDEAIGTSTVTTSSLGNWKHYALSFVSAASGVTSRLYIDGDLNEKKTLGTTGLGTVGGLLSGYIGALQTSPSASSAAQYAGKLSASLDEFRFWKTRRTSEEIYNNWHRDVGGGTNTDDANIKLGLYYKFNEGIVGDATYDAVVLDYSGRIANGSWTGYATGARNIGSAFLSSSHAITETEDPIIRSTHPSVVSIKSELEQSGSEWDIQNTTNLYYKTVPDWIKEEDEDKGGDNVKYLYQIVSSYFDTLYSQIASVPSLKDIKYPLEQGKALPFAKKLVESKGLIVNDILLNSTLLERVENIDTNKNHFEKSVLEIKNLIYTNLYNNMDTILKSKGNEKSIRNTLRCFGIDDELIKLNIYTDGGTHYFSDKYRQTSLMKKYINFFNIDRFNATVFQTSSTNNSLTYLTGSDSNQKEKNSAFTAEASVLFAKTLNTFETAHFKIPFKKSSVFGAHEAAAASGDYTWDSTDIANFQVYVEREKLYSDKAKFILETSDGTTVLSSSYFPEVYANQNWNLAVRIKPDKYPFQGNVVETTSPTYDLEFYGVNHTFGTVQSEFLLTSSLSNASGTAFLTKSKRFYVGAHRTNFTGSVLTRTDIKIGGFKFYLDYLSNDVIKQHNLDPLTHGLDKTYKSPTMFATDMGDKHIISSDLMAINWDFETVTGSDSSGKFVVEDVSSGSSNSKYGWIDNVARVENRGYGFGFPNSSTSVQKNEVIFVNRKQQPEISYNSDKVIIEDEERRNFIVDEDVSDNFYSIEKSMSQIISDEMLKMVSSIVEFNDLIGKATDRYKMKYKNLDVLRRIFYEKVEEDPDFDKFTRYYKWIDSSISLLVSQMFPISARNSKQISDIVESHILERSKYQNKFPLVKTFTSTESPIKGSSEMRYSWKFGHAPVDGNANNNQEWQKLRKEREDIANREQLRKIIITENVLGDAINLAKSDLTIYQKSDFAIRRLSKPYRISQDLKPDIHGGINYPPKKDRDVIYHLTQRHGDTGNYAQPINTVVAGAGTGNGINTQQEKDTLDPNLKTRVHLDVFAGRYSDNLYSPGAKDEDSTYAYRVTELDLPVTVMSQSVNSGYNSHVVSQFDSGSIITNIHSDTTTLSNHIPMQGPFPQTWVGGHQHRHAPVNRYDTSLRDDDTGTAPPNNLDNKYTRPEGWMLKLGDYTNNDGALGIVGPDYGGPYPDPARKVAVFYREERAKRPFNIKNIKHTTGSKNLGNFKENYEIISAGGKSQNNLYLRKNPEQSNYLPTSIGSILPETTHPMSLVGQAPFVSGNVFGTHHNNRQPDIESLTVVAPFVGTRASGSIKLVGVDYLTNFTSPAMTWTCSDAIRDWSIGSNSDSELKYYITGSTDLQVWNAFTASVKNIYSTYSGPQYDISIASSASAVLGKAFSTTGSSGTGVLSASVNNFLPSVFSFATWIKPDELAQEQWIFRTTSSLSLESTYKSVHQIYFDGSNRLIFNLKYSGSAGTGKNRMFKKNSFVDTYEDEFVHFAIVYDSGSNPIDAKLYINAISSSWDTTPVALPTNETYKLPTVEKIYVADHRDAGSSGRLRATLDEMMWWNTDLSKEEVESLYNCKVAVLDSNDTALPEKGYLRAFWKFGDHGSDSHENGGNINDISVGNNHLFVSCSNSDFFDFVDGIAATASYAVFDLTASANGTAYNQTININQCSFGLVNAIDGGIDDVAEDTRTCDDVVNAIITSSVTNTIISSRFSAPGGIETSYAYLDVYAKEYSPYNSLNYRNLTIRSSGSGESGTIRLNTHLGKREGLRTLLSRHCGKFGIDSQHGVVRSADYDTSPSFHKVHSNVGRRPTATSTLLVPVFNEDHNNAHFSSLLPRSDFQYSWVTSSLGSNYAVGSGKQRIYGYAPTDGIELSASAAAAGSIALGLLSSYTESNLDGFAIKYKISDGFSKTVIFQFVSGGSSAATGNTAVERDSGVFGGLGLQLAEGLKDAINSSALGITAARVDSTVNLTNDKLGREGNVFIFVDTDTSVSAQPLQNNVSGMSNGASTPIPALTFPSASEIYGEE